MWKCSLHLTRRSHNRHFPDVARCRSGAEQTARRASDCVWSTFCAWACSLSKPSCGSGGGGGGGRSRVKLDGVGLTLPVGRMPSVHVERLLALADGGGQRQVGLHHPLLVVAIDDGLSRHGQWVALGHVLGQRGERLLGLQEVDKQVGLVGETDHINSGKKRYCHAKLHAHLIPVSCPCWCKSKDRVNEKTFSYCSVLTAANLKSNINCFLLLNIYFCL